jgi:hypothetical protein
VNETPFYKTAMGRDFFDRNVPMLVKELKRLNDNLEKLIKQNEPKEKSDADRPGDGGR